MIELFADFCAGAFFCNALPHLAAGLRGEPFPSPFASPPGVGNSRPVVNVFWGMLNVVIGFALLGYAPVAIGFNAPFILLLLGGFIGGSLVARHFDRVRGSAS